MSTGEFSRQPDDGPGIPDGARRRQGPVACIECFQQIPCNPCEEACPHGAISVGSEITALPKLDEERCTGCGLCVTRCPGLAIFIVDESGEDGMARVGFPYEYVPLPAERERVRCQDREGRVITEGRVVRVRTSPAFDHTALITVEVPERYAMAVRSIDRRSVGKKDACDV